LGTTDSAVTAFQKVVELSGSEDSYISLGDLYVQKGLDMKAAGNEEAAIEEFNKAI
jgi:hypothetical protein